MRCFGQNIFLQQLAQNSISQEELRERNQLFPVENRALSKLSLPNPSFSAQNTHNNKQVLTRKIETKSELFPKATRRC